jgi:hypothetical protein
LKEELRQLKDDGDSETRIRSRRWEDLLRQAEIIKATLEEPNGEAVLEQIMRLLAELEVYKESIEAHLQTARK